MNVVFMGTPAVAIPTLQALLDCPQCSVQAVYTQPDRRVGRKKQSTPCAVKIHAQSLGIPVHSPQTAKAPEVLKELQRLEPALIIVCAYGQILPQALLNIPTIGCFNAHFSLLPRWRGASPVQAALRAGDRATGVSLQKVVLQLDAGPLVAASPPIPIHPADTTLTLSHRLSRVSQALLTQTLPQLRARTFALKEQEESEVTVCRTIQKEEGSLQWEKETAVEMERKLRAFTPWPGVHSFDARGKRLQILRLKVLSEGSHSAGVIQPDFVVGTQEQAVQILALKPEGKKEMSAPEFLRGLPQLVGTKLGE